MNRPENIKEELNGLNSSLPTPGETPYSVPEGYFEGLADAVMARIKEADQNAATEIAQLSPLLASISKQTPFQVPEGYFQSNLDGLKAITSDEESAMLSFVEKDQPYEVPAGYFDNLPGQIMEKIGTQSKVVPMRRKWTRLVVAALVAGVMALGGFFYFNDGSRAQNATETAATFIEKASTEELDAFIRATDVFVMDDNAIAQQSVDVKQLLQDVPDQELEAFLDQLPVDEDVFDIN